MRKKVIKNAENRKALSKMVVDRRLLRLEYYMSRLMEGHILQNDILKNGINNINVGIEKMTKKSRMKETEDK